MVCFARKLLCSVALMAVACLAGSAAADEIDTPPLPLKIQVAFPDVVWPGWKSPEETGIPDTFRPILVTYAADDSNRVFIPTQQGVVYVLPNDQKATTAKVFLDLSAKASYRDKQNEEGFLGLAFHPKYRENGQFFVYYTNKAKKRQNIVARYHVSKDDPNKADPNSEEILLTLDKPFWNHDGGTLAFGPDGYMYIAIGDGGLANDPYKNGQNLSKLLGKLLRIDVDHKTGDLPYAIPPDNPFVGKEDARGEIWAYGLRNVWRFAFDGDVLWAGDVGQDAWEEIDLIVKGGNYGWNIREGFHPFIAKGRKPPKNAVKPANAIDPVWDYDHNVGKSIIGGLVYRGKKIPELQGAYLYADYVSGKLWALRYDFDKKKVTANRPIPAKAKANPTVMSFGVDANGEVYFTIPSAKGQGVFMLLPPD